MAMRKAMRRNVRPVGSPTLPFELVRRWLDGVCQPIADRHKMTFGVAVQMRPGDVRFKVTFFPRETVKVSLIDDFERPIAGADLPGDNFLIRGREIKHIYVGLLRPAKTVKEVEPGDIIVLGGALELG
jgi:hypothetical protein